jgi:hypothetical protein
MADAIDIVRKSIDAWNAHDANGVAALVSNDYMFESDTVPAPLRGPDGVRQLVETYVKAFPDIRVERSWRRWSVGTTSRPGGAQRRPWWGSDGRPGNAPTGGDKRMQRLGGAERQSRSGVVLLGYSGETPALVLSSHDMTPCLMVLAP